VRDPYAAKSNHRSKFLIQNFVEGMDGDYKVVVYGQKYYVLSRKNRKNDFRASGSGIFEWSEEPVDGLFDFSKSVLESLDTPYISLDVGYLDSAFYLIEFQCLHFGNYTLEGSSFYFTKSDTGWDRVVEESILEREFARAVVGYIDRE